MYVERDRERERERGINSIRDVEFTEVDRGSVQGPLINEHPLRVPESVAKALSIKSPGNFWLLFERKLRNLTRN